MMMSAPREVLVEHSGYDLLNVGDTAMLMACAQRVRRRWPSATIRVVVYSEQRLATYVPGTEPLGQYLAQRRALARLPLPARLGLEQGFKTLSPFFPGGARSGTDVAPRLPPRSVREAVRRADVVIAAGGGYLCDTFWWHGAGVLSTLRMAQALGKPTALLGQGIGPLRNRALRRLTCAVLRDVDALGLREGVAGPQELRQLKVIEGDLPVGELMPTARGGVVAVTGDDAMPIAIDAGAASPDALAAPAGVGADQAAIGVNLRCTWYAGTRDGVPRVLEATVREVAQRHGAGLQALPVSRYAVGADLEAIVKVFGGDPDNATEALRAKDSRTPAELSAAVSRCRAVISGSYHAAVFSLALGVPVVGLSGSGYYDAKFNGLRHLFPEGFCLLRMDSPRFGAELSAAIEAAWALPPQQRAITRERALRQSLASDALFDAFASTVERHLAHGLKETVGA